MFKFGSLFSGIGGLDLGLERAGMKCVWQSEIHPYACRVLHKHWPHVPNLGDIRNIEWDTVAPVDVICGGYPCQPFSYAGARNGTDDPRHLWPYFANAISVVRPKYALLENVSGHLSLGFGQVLSDLAACGYDTEWDCIPAASVGAPHLRDRVFVIATRQHGMDTDSNSQPNGPIYAASKPWASPMADNDHQNNPKRTKSAGGNVIDGRCRWEVEPSVGRMADGVPSRMDRLRCLGNAVVPQVAEHIGHIINNMEANT